MPNSGNIPSFKNVVFEDTQYNGHCPKEQTLFLQCPREIQGQNDHTNLRLELKE
jgi:hypothetical protein